MAAVRCVGAQTAGSVGRHRNDLRKWVAKMLVGLLVVSAAVVLPGGQAFACSCGGATPAQLLEYHDVVFVGSVAEANIDDQIGLFSFDVEAWLLSDLDTATVVVDSEGEGASCGFELNVGERAAIFASQEDDRIVGGLCSTLDADVTLAALTGPGTASPGGVAHFAVTGSFDEGAFALLDIDGELVGYSGASESFPAELQSCPGGTHVVAVGFPIVQVIDLATMDAVRSVDTGNLQQRGIINGVSCTARDGSSVKFLYESDTGRLELRTLANFDTPGDRFDIGFGRSWLADSRVISLEYLDPGERLRVVDPDGTARVLGEVERPANSNFAGYSEVLPSGTGEQALAGEVTYLDDGSQSGRLVLFDLATGTEAASASLSAGRYVVGQVADGRWLTRSDENIASLELRDPVTLEIDRALEAWPAFTALVIGDDVWGVNGGDVLRGSLATNDVAVVTTLPTQITGEVVALPSPFEVEPTEAGTPVLAARAPTAQAGPDEGSEPVATDTQPERRSEPEADEGSESAAGIPGGETGSVVPGWGIALGAVAAVGVGAGGAALRRRRA